MADTLSNDPLSPEVEMLRMNKESGYNFRERRHEDWRQNYTLSRDKVSINRLLQRQSVNIPLMKTHLKTIMKDNDDMPVMVFVNQDNDDRAQIFQNEYWKWTLEQNKAILQDIIDKKQVFMFGRTFDQWQIVDGKVKWTVLDPQDILVSRYTDPHDIDSSRFLIHTHIFVPLSVIEANESYDKTAINELKLYFASQQGLIKVADNQKMLIEKNQKLADMGVQDVNSPVLGETYVEISLHFCYRKEKEDTEEQLYLYVEAEDMKILRKKRLEEVIGKTKDNYWKNHFPYSSWTEDIERQDFWSDAISDILRTPNLVLNAWFSQEVENRTLRNLNMHYYNSSLEGFQPQGYVPQPWGWYGIPVGSGQKISDVIQDVQVPQLQGNLEDMNFIMTIAEKATGATATQQGVENQRQITLGEIKLALNEAKERTKGISKFYTAAWKERAEKFLKLIEAAPDKLDAVKIFKEGRNSQKIYSHVVEPKNWMTESGYRVKIWSQDERDNKTSSDVEKLNAVVSNIPNNPKLTEIYQRKLLEFADISPDDVNEVMRIEDEKRKALALNPMGTVMANGAINASPVTNTPTTPALPVTAPATPIQ